MRGAAGKRRPERNRGRGPGAFCWRDRGHRQAVLSRRRVDRRNQPRSGGSGKHGARLSAPAATLQHADGLGAARRREILCGVAREKLDHVAFIERWQLEANDVDQRRQQGNRQFPASRGRSDLPDCRGEIGPEPAIIQAGGERDSRPGRSIGARLTDVEIGRGQRNADARWTHHCSQVIVALVPERATSAMSRTGSACGADFTVIVKSTCVVLTVAAC